MTYEKTLSINKLDEDDRLSEIPVFDHLLSGENNYFSFVDNTLL